MAKTGVAEVAEAWPSADGGRGSEKAGRGQQGRKKHAMQVARQDRAETAGWVGLGGRGRRQTVGGALVGEWVAEDGKEEIEERKWMIGDGLEIDDGVVSARESLATGK